VTEFVVAVLAVAVTVYGTSAGVKLSGRRAYASFRAGLGDTALVPRRWLRAAAAVLAGAETVVACLAGAALAATALAAGPAAVPAAAYATAALAAGVLLTGVLTAGVATVVRRGTRARCACFGSATDRQLGGAHLAGDVSLLAMLVAGLVGDELRPLRAGAALPAVAVAVVAGIAAGLLLMRFDDLAALFLPMSRDRAPG
jgi:hypothetical protein